MICNMIDLSFSSRRIGNLKKMPGYQLKITGEYNIHINKF